MSRAEGEAGTAKVVNVSTVPHRSPFRYPGGKTWLVPYVRRWLKSVARPPTVFAEPFAGGGIVGLSAIFERLASHLILVELDDDVASVWQAILGGNADELVAQIEGFHLTRENVEAALRQKPGTLVERAFFTILRNRVQHGGILAPGASLMKRGENDRGLASRWYVRTLRTRILSIARLRDRITFVHGDGVTFMADNARRDDMFVYIDPPYTVAGRRLYAHSEVDHEQVFHLASTLRGDFLMTYDNAEPVRWLSSRSGFDTELIPMQCRRGIVNWELLIGRNLDWARQKTPSSAESCAQRSQEPREGRL